MAGACGHSDEDGYLADWQQVDDQTFVLREFNRAVHHVARRFQQACGPKSSSFRRCCPTPPWNVSITSCGETFCGYRIVARQAGNP
ncbi:hypothetical protein [Candidatus Amarolinea dominans]|uniref:hypothetical protein n=1 Tax=Candidatus Amarolinea dominans TaxID=3140696 RepID=UPI0031CCBEEF